MQIDYKTRELTVKLVYYGPALSGKTTNLEAIHRLIDPQFCGRLMNLETRDDRTLFFDLLPLAFESASGLHVRIKLFTVPGQVMHDATRRLVLQGVDGVAFIADSQLSETHANLDAFRNMQKNLRENGFVPEEVPLVIQFNKRDLPNIRSDEEIDYQAARGTEPVFKAIALRGVGVLETLIGLFERTWASLEAKHGLEEKFGVGPEAIIGEMRARLGVPMEAA
ncbi:MAG: gliding motility protein [Myxococcales bacterium]|jgi:signal recognition particle receptor subunit beta|nr:gliding motility protein [Myxococcales bacterium]